MAITHTGADGTDWDFDQPTGVFNIGSSLSTRNPNFDITYGIGGTDIFTINAGDSLELISDRIGFDPYLGIGTGTGANGTVIVDGLGSILSIAGAGKTVEGASTQIGFNGGTGVLTLSNSGVFSLVDLVDDGADVDVDFFNAESVGVGRGTGGNGAINLSGGSSFELIGAAAGMGIGIRGGTGVINVAGSSTFVVRNLADEVLDGDSNPEFFASVDIRIGRGKDGGGTAGQGTLTVQSDSTVTIGGLAIDGQRHGASVHVGREGGKGTLEVLDGGTFNVHAADDGAALMIGFRDVGSQGSGGSEGTLDVDDGIVDVLNQDGFAQIGIGVNGALGVATVDNGGKLRITAENAGSNNAGAGLVVGGFNGNAAQGTGGNGTLTVDGATSSVDIVSDMNAEFNTGDGEGTLGTSTFQNGAAFSITGTDFAALNVGRDGGDGLVDIQTGASATLGGADTQIWIGTAYGNDAEAGLGEIRVQSGGGIVFAGTSNSLNVGGSADARGLLNVLSGGAIDLGGGDGYVWSSGAGSSAHAIVDGAGSRIDNIGFFGVGRYDTGIAAGAAGKLTVSNSGVVGNAGAVLQFGSGGTLAGRNGTLVGDVEFKSGGKVDLRDNALGTMTLDGNGTITGAGNSLFLDVSAAGNDRLIVDGGFHNTGSLAVTLNALSGYKFVKGQSKTIATFDGGDTGNGTYTVGVTGQQSDFSYYVGKLGANLKNVVLVALNNGNTASAANAGILDFVSGAAAKFVYNSATQTGTVLGGKFGADGGYAVKVDDIRGTNGVDNFSVTGTTARVLKFDGKGGNDIIKGGAGVDTILGGVGNDTILGNNGNDILQGDTGKDTMTGGLGNDTFKFTLKTHSAASHTLADVIMDFDDKGNDKIDLAGIYGPKLSYIGAAAFTKVGQVRVNDIAGPDVIVEVNLSGSLASDFAIRLKGTTLAQVGLDDFVL